MNICIANRRLNAGSSLLEVLIAAVILSIGLLGISALQLSTLQGADNTEYRNRAAAFTSSLAERMRANKAAADHYLTSAIALNNSGYCSTLPAEICSMSLPGKTASEINVCSAEQLARFDLWELRCSSGIRDLLPGGQLTITSPATAIYQINIRWLTRNADNAEKSLSDSLSLTLMPGIEHG